MTATLDDQVQAWLAAVDKTGVNNVDYMLVDHSDGKGAQIGMWNAETIGTQPTQAQLDSVSPEAEAISAARDQTTLAISIQRQLDTEAQAFGYDSIISACSYVNSGVDLWSRQAIAFVEWRDNVWVSFLNGAAIPEPAVPEE